MCGDKRGFPVGQSAERIEQARQRFEQIWQMGQTPRIEDFLDKIPSTDRSRLLEELLKLELHYRRQRGESATLAEYATRFPEAEALLEEGSLDGTSESCSPETGTILTDELASLCRDQSSGLPQPAMPEEDPDTATTRPMPERCGRYRILTELGRGSFGTVALAEDGELERNVAIKLLHPEFLRSPRDVAAFQSEARILARLDHPHIVPVYDCGQLDDGQYFVVSKYIDGGSLEDWLNRGRLTSEEAAEIVACMADALHFAHLQGLIHRDVKPANILMDSTGRPLLADFGLALHEAEQRFRRDETSGSPAYMSPEQIRGESHLLDGRTDVWSLGAVLYQLLAGRRPFGGSSITGLFEEIREREPKPLRMIEPNVPSRLEEIALKCLQKPIADRYRTAADVAEALRSWRKDQHQIARANSAAGELEPLSRAPFAVPFPRNEDFVGRDQELAALHDALQDHSPAGLKAVSLSGMGGVGKTQLAVEYAYRYRDDYSGGILWVNAAESLAAGLAGLVELLPIDRTQRSVESDIRAVAGYFERFPRSLLVVDNLSDPAELNQPLTADVVPAALDCRLLFTTRKQVSGRFSLLELTTLSEAAALSLLLRHEGRRVALDPDHPDHGEALRICRLLGNLPLALEVAGAHLGRRPAATLTLYRDELLRRGALAVLDDPRLSLRSTDLPTRHEAAVEATLLSQWDTLELTDSRQLLSIAGQLPESAEISVARLALLAGLPDDEQSFFGPPVSQAIDELQQSALIEVLRQSRDGARIRLHPLVREFAARRIPPDKMSPFRRRCATTLARAFTSFSSLEEQIAKRGVDAVQVDLVTALELGEETASDESTPVSRLRDLLRVLQQEAHNLREWDQASSPAQLGQQLLYRAMALGLQRAARDARQRLADLDCPCFSLMWRAGHELQNLELVLVGHEKAVLDVTITPDGRRIVSASADRTVRIWNLTTGQLERTLLGHEEIVRAVAVLPDGKRLVSADDAGQLLLWNIETGLLLQSIGRHADAVNSLAVLPDGQHIVSASDDGTLKVWELTTGEVECTLKGHAGIVFGVTVTSEGRQLLSAGADGTVRIWDAATGELQAVLSGHGAAVLSVAVAPDGSRAASVSVDGTTIIWDLAGRQEVRRLEGRYGSARDVSFTPDGRRLVVPYWSRRVKLWDVVSGEELATLAGHERAVLCTAVTYDGRRVICGSHDRTIKVWDLGATRMAQAVPGHTHGVNDLIMVSETRQVVSASDDRTISVWDLDSGTRTLVLTDATSPPISVAAVDGGTRVVAALDNRTLTAWNGASGERQWTVNTHAGNVNRLIAIPTESKVVSAADDGQLKIWNAVNGVVELAVTDPSGVIRDIAVTADDRWIISAAADGSLCMRGAADGHPVKQLDTQQSRVVRLCVVGEHRIVVLTNDGCISVWNSEARAQLKRFALGSQIQDMAVTVDGKIALIVTRDRRLEAWSLDSERKLAMVRLDSWLRCVTVACDEHAVVVGDITGNLYCLRFEQSARPPDDS